MMGMALTLDMLGFMNSMDQPSCREEMTLMVKIQVTFQE
jgi:hypothetical protein